VEPAAENDLLRAQALKDRETIALQANTIASLTIKVEVLEALVKKLVEQQSRNSTNSNLPPSSDGPGGSSPKTSKKPDKKGRKRGGQPGHKGSHRLLVPAEQVHEFIDMFPARCDDCHESLPKTPDPDPTRHQHIELAPLLPTSPSSAATRCAARTAVTRRARTTTTTSSHAMRSARASRRWSRC